jgi:hypothetical protein
MTYDLQQEFITNDSPDQNGMEERVIRMLKDDACIATNIIFLSHVAEPQINDLSWAEVSEILSPHPGRCACRYFHPVHFRPHDEPRIGPGPIRLSPDAW